MMTLKLIEVSSIRQVRRTSVCRMKKGTIDPSSEKVPTTRVRETALFIAGFPSDVRMGP